MSEYRIPGRFSPTSSILGRFISILVKDRIRSEALFIVVSTFAVLALIFFFYADSSGLSFGGRRPVSKAYLTVAAVVSLLCWVGYKPSILVKWDHNGVVFTSPRHHVSWIYSEMMRVQILETSEYHRKWRRSEGVTEFINALTPSILLFEFGRESIAVGLPEHVMASVLAYIDQKPARTPHGEAEKPVIL